MKTSAFCNRLKKVTCDKIGNTYHIKLKRQFLRTSGSEEAMFWEIQFFLLLISPFLQVKVEAHNPFRSIVEYIQICVCIYIYIYLCISACTASFAMEWWEGKGRKWQWLESTHFNSRWIAVSYSPNLFRKRIVYLFSFEVSVTGKQKKNLSCVSLCKDMVLRFCARLTHKKV